MIVFNQKMLDVYLKNDWVLKQLMAIETKKDRCFRAQKWLREMDNKRMIFPYLYGELLTDCTEYPQSVIDVGGGFTSFTRRFLQRTEYTLLDFMAHGEGDALREIEANCESRKAFWEQKDWFEYDIRQNYDLVIANDIFPDVDQRLELFLYKFLPHCIELRILLTYYNEPKFYTTRRIDDTEVLTFLSWDGEIMGMKLEKYLPRMKDTKIQDLKQMRNHRDSIYRNGRQVAYISLQGDLA